MNKSELAQALSNKTDMNKADAQRAIDAIFSPEDGVITDALRQGDRVQITGFGTFETRERKARTGRNPRTGLEIRIGPTTSASFRPGKALKDAVKLGGRWPGPSRLWYVSQQLVVDQGVEEVNRLLERVMDARASAATTAG